MNAYQKATILVATALSPPLLLYMKIVGHASVWIAGAVGLGVASLVFYALRNARTE